MKRWIAFIFKNFEASVSIKESDRLQILPCDRDGLVFQDVHDLTKSVNENGYYGGVRLIKAAKLDSVGRLAAGAPTSSRARWP